MSAARAILRIACCLLLIALAPVARAAAPDAVTPDGGQYYGPLVDGRFHGSGRIEWPNGARYVGAFERGLYSGKARLSYATGELYEGTFRDGMPHGQGYFTSDFGTYTGQFEQGMFSGQGEMRYSDGRKYRGEWKRGRMHGKGRLELPDGGVYEGDFVSEQFTGRGTYTGKDGRRHEGEFRKWHAHGPGRSVDGDGNTYEGSFVDGDTRGPFRVTFANGGGSYEGELREWRPHGQGVLRLPDGDVYSGAFEHGMYHGHGTLTHAARPGQEPVVEKGTWRYGALSNPRAERELLEHTEKALYSQRALLDKALSALAPRQTGKINLYLLAVAGDGSQEVFRREVQFVQRQFDERFGTRTRSVRLVNSRSTLATEPMATVSSIREALNTIARRMDRSEDILFLYLTSHGSEKREFTLNQKNVRLRGLTAAELGSMLKESGIRWKVIVISACYSGGFIDALKDRRTLVITAARHDRRSFGCADENDFTYFGRAYFEEALPASKSFREAFTKAEVLVRQREEKELKAASAADFSLPQISGSREIDEQVRRWWRQLPDGGAR